ncbi:hypothetical protein CW712_04010 [Candidatus Bathyarchaeota archaeon]|nr:MAG: hypothetical protein CW712_04010 [Candidatus Bathyarchaeota archaeon]
MLAHESRLASLLNSSPTLSVTTVTLIRFTDSKTDKPEASQLTNTEHSQKNSVYVGSKDRKSAVVV